MSSKKAKRPTSSTSSSSAGSENRREALRAQQAAQARQKRNQRILAIVAGVIALAIIAVVATVAWQDYTTKKEQRERESNTQIVPPNALDKKGIIVNPKASGAKYMLDVYVDYQCPHCAETEKAFGQTWKQLMDDGTVQLRVHTMTFMEEQVRNTHSTDLAIGAACADVSGKYWQFHSAVFANQSGQLPLYTDDLVKKGAAEQAGLTGAELEKWQKCFDNKSTSQFVREVHENAGKDGVTGTPTIKVNGKNPKVKNAKGEEVSWWAVLKPTKESWVQGLADAAK